MKSRDSFPDKHDLIPVPDLSARSRSTYKPALAKRSASVSSRSRLYPGDDSSVRSGSSARSGASGTSLSSTFTADSGKHSKSSKRSSSTGRIPPLAHSEEKTNADSCVNGGTARPSLGKQEEDTTASLLRSMFQPQDSFRRHQRGVHQYAGAASTLSRGRNETKVAAAATTLPRRCNYQKQESLRRLRGVRFNECMNQWHESTITSDELARIWWGEEDYTDFYESMVLAVSAITTVPEAETEESCRNVLGLMYKACCETDNGTCHSPGGTITGVVLNGDQKRKLKSLFKATPDLLGLERSVSSLIGQDRVDRRNALIEKIEDLQSCGWPDNETEARKLAEASIHMTRPSRLFARQVAMGIVPPSSNSSSYASMFAPPRSKTPGSGKSKNKKRSVSRMKVTRSQSARTVVESSSSILPMIATISSTETTADVASKNATSSTTNTRPPSRPRKSKSKRSLSRSSSTRTVSDSNRSSSSKSATGSSLKSSQSRNDRVESTCVPTKASYSCDSSFKGLNRSVII